MHAAIASRHRAAPGGWAVFVLLACGLGSDSWGQPRPLLDAGAIAAGGEHSCTALVGGGVRCWGRNDLAQLGDGTRSDRRLPVAVADLPQRVLQLAAGEDHSCALLSGGELRCWGLNFYGQLGSGDTELGLRPVAPRGLGSGLLQVSAGENHSCALTAAGGVKCWGANYSGQLGDGTLVDRNLPVDVQGLTRGVRSIVAGYRHSCAVTEAGAIKCWGFNFAGQLGDGSTQDRPAPVDVVGLNEPQLAVAAGDRHSCALAVSGAVKCWGANAFSQLGNDGDENNQLTPVAVIGLDRGVSALDLGSEHSCARLGDGGVLCWGRNDVGQLGDGSIARGRRPVSVQGLRAGAQAIAIGQFHGCALQDDGSLRCWGLNFAGQLGDGSLSQRFTPVATGELAGPAQAVDVGEEHSCALLQGVQGNAVHCWGLNFFGQLGDGGRVQRLLPGPVSGLDNSVSALDSGGFFNCALRAGAVSCWGRNDFGQLGNAETADRELPVPVVGLASAVQAISSGGQHSCALRAGGVRCWGHNFAGQLGDGSREPRSSPVLAVGLGSGVRAIATGFFAHSCAIGNNGALSCWGANARGQLGDGSRVERLTPVGVSGLINGVQAVALGGEHSCAVVAAGAVKCWGNNDNFQLGDGSSDERLAPVDVQGLLGPTRALALGRSHSCALSEAGGVACWGRNDAGQLGDGSRLQRPRAVPVTGLRRGVLAISAGAEHSCAVLSGGAIRCWGSNYSGQFGDGNFGGRPLAVEVKLDREPRARPAAAGDAPSKAPASDASGRYLLFESSSASLVAGDDNGARDVFRSDTHLGLIERVSVDNAGAALSGDAGEASLSADGQRLVFVAADAAVARVAGESAKQRVARIKGGQSGLFLRNVSGGTTQRLATALPSGSDPALAANGGAVAFTAINGDPQLGPAGSEQVYVLELDDSGGGIQPGSLSCVSCKRVAADGSDSSENSDGEAASAALSADGRTVVFSSSASTLQLGGSSPCPGASSQVFLRNLDSGVVSNLSVPSGGSCSAAGSSGKPSIDYAATRIVFESSQPLLAGDDNQLGDVFVYDLASASLTRLSESALGIDGNGASSSPSISGDGSTVAFSSEARNLTPGQPDDNEVADILLRNLSSGITARASSNQLGDQADGASAVPVLNFAGTRVAFESDASNLLLGSGVIDSNGVTDLFQTGSELAAAPLKSATWWRDSEAGWGLFIFDQGNLLAPAWFTYDSDGEPTWFLASGALAQADGSFRGDLFRFTGVPLAQITGAAIESSRQVGTLGLRFIGEDGLQFDYSVDGVSQSKSMTRFPFGSRQLACRPAAEPGRQRSSNYSDVWWGGESSSGWGLFINHLDDALFAVWYTYDVDREPLFLVLSTTRQADGSFAGEVFRQANGTPFSMIADAPPSATASAIGRASFRFSDGGNGVFSYTLGAVVQSKSISRLLVGTVASDCESVVDQ